MCFSPSQEPALIFSDISHLDQTLNIIIQMKHSELTMKRTDKFFFESLLFFNKKTFIAVGFGRKKDFYIKF